VSDVLLDARLTRRMSAGMSAYARELARRLPRVAPDLTFDVYRDGGNFGYEEQIRLPLYAQRTRPRFVHHLSVYAPLWMPRPFAITIHDLIHLRYPEQFKRSVGPYYTTVVRAVCARATRVITDDARTVADLERFLGVDPRKVRVIPLGADDIFFEPHAPEDAAVPYIMYAGNHRRHKDLATLVAAWQALPAGRAVDLVVTGAADVPELGELRTSGAIRCVGDVDAARLARLYRGAVAYVHPAWFEGFGLPMLEAAAAGTPVIAAEESLPAILAPYARTFQARDAQRLGALLQSALERPPADEERERQRAAVRSYTWDRVAAATAEVYRDALEESPVG
jgi:glycosyltransferase involved in cell wall biosynthesis